MTPPLLRKKNGGAVVDSSSSEEPKKKPGLALVISMGKHEGEEEAEEEGEEYTAARDELADLLGVAEEDREAFGDALKAFMSCC